MRTNSGADGTAADRTADEIAADDLGPDTQAPDEAADQATTDDRSVDQLADAVLSLLRSWRALTHRAAEGGAPSTVAVLELVRLLGEDERRMTEIAVLRGVDQSVVSRQIGELEARHLVCRRPDPADRRASLVRLTPAGHELLGELAELRRSWLRGALSRVPGTDVVATARLVTAVAEEIAERAAVPTRPAVVPAPRSTPEPLPDPLPDPRRTERLRTRGTPV